MQNRKSTHADNSPQPSWLKRFRWLLISIPVIAALAVPLSYEIGQRVYRQQQLRNIEHVDEATFREGLAFVAKTIPQDAAVVSAVLRQAETLEPERARDLLLVIASATPNNRAISDAYYDALSDVIRRLSVDQAVGLHDALSQIDGVDAERVGVLLLEDLQLPDDASLRRAVELLEPRLLWAESRVKADWWVRWLSQLAESPSELPQLQAARGLGSRPADVDDQRIVQAMQQLAQSEHIVVRAQVLQAVAGYAAIANDPIDYEQIIFALGEDRDKTIARQAWMVVGHLNPLSGFAVRWRDAAPFVAEAMLWAAAKTNPDRAASAWEAFDQLSTRALSSHALGQLADIGSAERFAKLYADQPEERIELDLERLIASLSNSEQLPPAWLEHAVVAIRVQDRLTGSIAARMIRSDFERVRLLGILLSGVSGARPTLITGPYAELFRVRPELTRAQIHAMPDAELSELGFKRVDALTVLLDAAENAPASAGRQSEAKLLQLSLWMRGDMGDDFIPTAEAMLFDDEMPTSTVLMCLLHMKRPVALDYLLGDLVTPRPDLHDLFIGKRWWHVFRRFVDTSDLTLWLWGDPAAQRFQLEAMRQWYAVNRWRIAEGWWPMPTAD